MGAFRQPDCVKRPDSAKTAFFTKPVAMPVGSVVGQILLLLKDEFFVKISSQF